MINDGENLDPLLVGAPAVARAHLQMGLPATSLVVAMPLSDAGPELVEILEQSLSHR